MYNLSTLDLCLYLRDSLHIYGYDTRQKPNDAILIHGTRIVVRLLENRGIPTYPKLSFQYSEEGLWQSEELEIELSKVPEDYYGMSGLFEEVLGLIAESSEKAIKCIKPLLKSQSS